MTCDRDPAETYERAELGLADPHLAECARCRAIADGRAALVAALPRVGGDATGDPAWQRHVWDRIAAAGLDRPAAPVRRRTRRAAHVTGAVAAIAAVVLAVVVWPRPRGTDGGRPRIEIVAGPRVLRSKSAEVGDRIRIYTGAGDEIRVYRDEQAILWCAPPDASGTGCTRDRLGPVAELALDVAGEYQVVIVSGAHPPAPAGLDRDLAAVVVAGGRYELTELSVR